METTRTPEPAASPAADPRRVMDQLDDEEGRERSTRRKVRDLVRPAEEPARIRVSRQHRGRRTGWAVECSEHGAVAVLFPRRSMAKEVAVDHGRGEEHPEGARVLAET